MRLPSLKRAPVLLAAPILWIAASASAGPLDGLAPPGPCAEPREAVSGTGLAEGASELAVVGALQSFFSPSDVAAAPEAATPPAPGASAAAVRYPGACESGGSACLASQRSAVGNPVVVPGTRPGAKPRGPEHPPTPRPKVPVVPGVRPGAPAHAAK